jgi:hypothetical protein
VAYGGQRERLTRSARASRHCTPTSRRGQSDNPGGRSAKRLPALWADALNETVAATIDARRRKITKREVIVTHDGR